MHAVVMESLEEYLAGVLKPAAQQEIEAHLNACDACREEIRSMQEVSQWFVSLRSEETVDPALGFCARVMDQVRESKAVPSLANVFGLNFAWERRLIFASLLYKLRLEERWMRTAFGETYVQYAGHTKALIPWVL